jgi:glycosyltransferase involved in cell wall biosynthesis
MKLEVILCTHNPRRDLLKKVLTAIGTQTLAKPEYHVWVVDNGSSTPLDGSEMAPLKSAGARYGLLQEAQLGLVFARLRALRESESEWVVFVDDDAVLYPDYLEQAARIAEQNPKFGCFGGKLLLPASIKPLVPKWAEPMLPYLAIKDNGDQPITNCVDEWGPWEPPGAGAVVRRPLLELFQKRLKENPQLGRLGRRGSRGLFSSEDSLMMRGGFTLGLANSYQPALKLEHHIAPHRFQFGYLARLLYGLGRSQIILEKTLGRTIHRPRKKEAWRLLRKTPLDRVKFCHHAFQWGWFVESRAQTAPPP